MGWEMGGRFTRERMYMPMDDSCWGLTENSKILWSNYLSIKKKIKKIAISWTSPQIYWIRIAEAWNHKPLPGKMIPSDTVAGGEWICLWKSLSSSVSFTPWSKENVHRRMNLNMWYKYMDCMPSLYSCYHSHWLEFKGGECSLSWISTGLHRPARKE